ncbi:MAG: DNA-binding protein [Sphingobacteriia bacterium]|nr:DNA-binding protein [Sphingobacteriia bacterium]
MGSDPEPSLTRAEAAAFLGISVAFLKKLDLAGRGPVAVRIGRRWTYLRSDLLAFRDSCRTVPTPKPIAAIEPISAANDAENEAIESDSAVIDAEPSADVLPELEAAA